MKLCKNWKRIFAGIMACIMLFLTIDASAMTAFATEIQEQNNESEVINEKSVGCVPIEFISVDKAVFKDNIYDYRELAGACNYSLVYNNEWNKYTTYYYYNQLSTEWKQLWNALDAVCLDYLLNDVDANQQRIENVDHSFLEAVTLPEYMTEDMLKQFVALFLNSNPQYYFLNNAFLISGEEGSEYIDSFAVCSYHAFAVGAVRAQATSDLKEKIDSVLAEANFGPNVSESDKLKYVHDYIVNKVEYNHTITEDDIITNEEDESAFSQSAYSVFCMDKTVCAGYAEALSLLCNGLNVDAITVTSADHMWNKVRIEDSWYNVDATWADQNVTLYDYYGRSDEVYDSDADENRSSHTELTIWEGYLPLCTLDATPIEPYVEPGNFPNITKTAPIPNIVSHETSSGTYTIYITPTIVNGMNNTISIYYTTDGSVPSVASSKAVKYTSSFEVEEGYDVRAICVVDGCYDSDVVRGTQVPNIDNLNVDNRFYNRMIVSWDSLGDKVDGYKISVENFATGERITSEYLDKSKNSYTINTTNLEAGTKLKVTVCSYVGESNNMQLSGEYMTMSTVMAAPLENVDFTWFVRNWHDTDCLAINLESGYLLYHYLKDTGVNPYETANDMFQMTGEPLYLFDPEFAPYNEEGYVIVCDKNMTTAWQELGVLVGGEFKSPVLQPIADVAFSTTGQTATLTATITNPMENFDYRYQWYVADSAEGDAVVIDGATNASYVASVDADETKYYFCRVTCEYGDIVYFDTNNGNGGRTAVSGSMVGAVIQITPIDNHTYTSFDIEPDVFITINGQILTKGQDYTISYVNNKDVGTARVYITFCGNYSGTKTVTFEIVKAGAMSEFVTPIPDYIYTGEQIKPEVNVTGLNGETLIKGTDYVISYDVNQNKGLGYVHIDFIKNYYGTIHCPFQIRPKTLDDENIVTEDCAYTGAEVLHKLVVKDGEFTLVEGTDYKVIYEESEDRVNVGTVAATVEFINNYTGTVEITYKIVPKSAELLQITTEDQEYTGTAVVTNVLVLDGEKELKLGVDYDIVFSDNIELSTEDNLAKATLTFKGNYTGIRVVEFKILPRKAGNCKVKFAIPNQVYSYTGKEIKPKVEVTDGEKTLIEGTDYTVEYLDNIDVGKAKVKVIFKGNYSGSTEVKFSIISKSITAADLIIEGIEGIKDFIYNGKEQAPDISIKDMDLLGTVKEMLRAGVDYVVTIVDNIFAGVATIMINFKEGGNYNYIGDAIVRTFIIGPRTTDHVVISEIQPRQYTGSAIMPELEVKDTEANIVLVKDQDYTVEYQNNVNVGTATVLVSFKGNFTGETKTVTFSIYEPTPPTPPTPPAPTAPSSITSNAFHVNESNGYIGKITTGTSVAALWSSFAEKDYVVICDRNGAAVSGEAVVATGMTASIMNGNTTVKQYTIVVTGDTNGDGKINITDMIAVKASTLKKSDLSGAYEKAGDVNGDGKINITDFIKVKATTLKKDTIVGVEVK